LLGYILTADGHGGRVTNGEAKAVNSAMGLRVIWLAAVVTTVLPTALVVLGVVTYVGWFA
jgi:hypothetical protein